MRNDRHRVPIVSAVRVLLGVLLLTAASLPALAQSAPRAGNLTGAPARKLPGEGLPNLGQVTETLYRSGQPKDEGYAQLKRLGIEIVVNLREERSEIEAERSRVEALGIRYVSIPWNSWRDPSDEKIAEFLELVRTNPQKRILVHCHHGADRTGVMVAVYRMADERWTSRQALDEMNAFHFHRILLHHLQRYVEDFPERLRTSQAVRAQAAPAQASPN